MAKSSVPLFDLRNYNWKRTSAIPDLHDAARRMVIYKRDIWCLMRNRIEIFSDRGDHKRTIAGVCIASLTCWGLAITDGVMLLASTSGLFKVNLPISDDPDLVLINGQPHYDVEIDLPAPVGTVIPSEVHGNVPRNTIVALRDNDGVIYVDRYHMVEKKTRLTLAQQIETPVRPFPQLAIAVLKGAMYIASKPQHIIYQLDYSGNLVSTSREEGPFKGTKSPIIFCTDGRFLIVGAEEGGTFELKLYDTETGVINNVVIEDGNFFAPSAAVFGRDTLYVWDTLLDPNDRIKGSLYLLNKAAVAEDVDIGQQSNPSSPEDENPPHDIPQYPYEQFGAVGGEPNVADEQPDVADELDATDEVSRTLERELKAAMDESGVLEDEHKALEDERKALENRHKALECQRQDLERELMAAVDSELKALELERKALDYATNALDDEFMTIEGRFAAEGGVCNAQDDYKITLDGKRKALDSQRKVLDDKRIILEDAVKALELRRTLLC